MENIFVEFLPPWVETGLQPAFYDKESGTVLQQTARMYARVNMLIRMFNKLSKNTKEEVERFETSVNETVENYIEQFNQLHDYVHDYFDNLDVQEEINNKLDQMVEDGVLQEIITTYIQSNVAWTFDTVADMKLGANLVAGSYAQTLGFYNVNDGGGATYKITDTVSASEHQETLNSGLYATLIVTDGILNVKTVGVKSDASYDNTSTINTALSYANQYAIYFPYGFYRTSYLSSLTVSTNIKIYGDNATIKLLDDVITADNQRLFTFLCSNNINILIEMSGLNIDMNYTNNHSVIDTSGDQEALQHCHAIFVYGSNNSNIDVIFQDLTFNDLIADGINLGGGANNVVNKGIINNIISQNRTAFRSDICITCDFDRLTCSDLLLDRFEIEVNSTRNDTRRTVLLNNIDVLDTLDLDIGNNDGENVLYANNIRVSRFFYNDIEKATYTNCIFQLGRYVRLIGKKIQFINCDFYTKDNTNFTLSSTEAINYMYTAESGMDLQFKNCNIKYNNAVLTSTSDAQAFFLRGGDYYAKLVFDNCTFDISSMVTENRGGETTISNCNFKTTNEYVSVFCRFMGQTTNTASTIYLQNNKSSSNIKLLQPPITGQAMTIYENNPEWPIGNVFNFTRFDKITSFNGGSGSIITIKELTEFYNNAQPASGIWIKGQIIKNSNPSTDYMWVCTKSGSLDSGSTVPTFATISI